MAGSRNLFHRAHYNILAKQFRTSLSKYYVGADALDEQFRQGAAVVDLALSLAKRLSEDNENFNPLTWLDACSPDVELYPLSELWDA